MWPVRRLEDGAGNLSLQSWHTEPPPPSWNGAPVYFPQREERREGGREEDRGEQREHERLRCR